MRNERKRYAPEDYNGYFTRPQSVGMMSAVRESPVCRPRPSIEAAAAPDLRAHAMLQGGNLSAVMVFLACSRALYALAA